VILTLLKKKSDIIVANTFRCRLRDSKGRYIRDICLVEINDKM